MQLKKLKNRLRKYKKLFNLLSKIKLHVKGLYFYIFMKLFSCFPINKQKIIVVSYAGKGYGDNGKYIVDELLKDDNVIIYWATKKSFRKTLPSRVRYTKFNSIIYLFHLATAKVWINNARFEFGTTKREGQFYIQTWHSSLRLKKIEKDAIEHMNPQYVKTCIYDSKMIDIIISGCGFSSKIYKNAFWYDGKVEECGTPRCDIFFNKTNKVELKKKIFGRYGIPEDKIIILYAPTFRKGTDEEKCYLNIEKFIDKLDKKYELLVRFHPISKYTLKTKSPYVKNVTDYEDMQELLCVSDYLITDYSGCCFDMMINNKPCLLFTKDLENYLSKERELYFDFNSLPFYNTKTEEELARIIQNFDRNDYKKRIDKFEKEIVLFEDGHAAERIANIILKQINTK